MTNPKECLYASLSVLLKRFLDTFSPCVLTGILIVAAVGSTHAASPFTRMGGDACMADDKVSTYRIPAPLGFEAERQSGIRLQAPSPSITFLGPDEGLGDDHAVAWPEEAKTAFSYAARIWAYVLNSQVKMTVKACWADNLSAGVLGHSRPLDLEIDFDGAPRTSTWYPVTLANALTGKDFDESEADMYIAFSSSNAYYFGTDGNCPTNRYDFVQLVLHEIAHGLGFTGTMKVSDGRIGEWGTFDVFSLQFRPDVYDRHAVDRNGKSLVDGYEDKSVSLGVALTDDVLYFNGASAFSGNNGAKVQLYAPYPWDQGSSFSHLGEVFNNTPDALMTYSLSYGESVHSPGPVIMGLLRDLGWPGQALLAWGANDFGRLGTGDTAVQPQPVQVGVDFVDVSSNGSHTLAIRRDGTVWAWGWNGFGQLGGPVEDHCYWPTRSGNVVVKADQVAAGEYFSMARTDDGNLLTWGINSNGQLGIGSSDTNAHAFPSHVMSDVSWISAGKSFGAAVKTDGTVWAWGDNSFGQLGDGTTTQRNYPTQVPGLSNINRVDCGYFHTLALGKDGSVWAWGRNNYAQVGGGSTADRLSPVRISSLATATAVSAGEFHSMALTSDGTVWCWGRGDLGQLGTGSLYQYPTQYSASPVKISDLTGLSSGVTAISAGQGFSMAVKSDGSAWAWGSNVLHELGDGTKNYSYVPIQIAGMAGVYKAVACHFNGFLFQSSVTTPSVLRMAVSPSGAGSTLPSEIRALSKSTPFHIVACPAAGYIFEKWSALGDAALGEAVFGDTSRMMTTVSTKGDVTVTANFVSSRPSSNTVMAWGDGQYGKLGDGATTGRTTPVAVSASTGLVNTSFIDAGGMHTLAIRNGTVWGWGWNFHGQLGIRTSTPQSIYPANSNQYLQDVTQLSSGWAHSLALRSDGTVWGFGINDFGQLGNGMANGDVPNPFPIKANLPVPVLSVAAGFAHSVAVDTDRCAWAWGWNGYGQLGDSSDTDRHSPQRIDGLTTHGSVLSVDAGYGHTLALLSDGSVYACGWNKDGQLGDGTTSNRSTYVKTAGLSNIVSVAAGKEFSLALKSDGTVWAWGDNIFGQLGDGTQTAHAIPAQVLGLSDIGAIDAGDRFALALGNNGTVWAWGDNSSGQLGNGITAAKLSPIQIPNLADITAVKAGKSHALAISEKTATAKLTILCSPPSSGETTPSAGDHTVNKSELQSIQAVPFTGYKFAGWTATPCASLANPSADSTTVTLIGNATVTANFTPNTYTLFYTAGTGGTLTGSIAQIVNHGSNGTQVTAVPNAGYRFTGWSDGVSSASRIDINVTANLMVTANFELMTYILTYHAGTGGTVLGDSPQIVAHGASGTSMHAAANTGYQFTGWSDGVSTASRTDSNVTGDITVTANFAKRGYTLTYVAEAGGTIRGVNPQTVLYRDNGTEVTAIPDRGYRFTKWGDDLYTASRTDTDILFDMTLRAYFTPFTYTLTYTAGTGGTIRGANPQAVNHGSSGTPVSAVSNTGYRFIGWNDGVSTAERIDSNVTANISAIANFAVATYALTVENGSGSGNYEEGAVVSIFADQMPHGQVFKVWTGSDTITDVLLPQSTLVMPASTLTVTAVYTPIGWTSKIAFTSGRKETSKGIKDSYTISGTFNFPVKGEFSPVKFMTQNAEIGIELGDFTFSGVLGEATKYKPGAKSGYATFNSEFGDTVTCQWYAKKISVTVKSNVPFDTPRNIIDLSNSQGAVSGTLENCRTHFDKFTWSEDTPWSGKVTIDKKKGYLSWTVRGGGTF